MSDGQPCPACGHEDGNCTGGVRTLITESGVVKTKTRMRVPKQHVRFGRHGYVGNVEVYDPEHPHIRFVDVPRSIAEDFPQEKPKKVARKKKPEEEPEDAD